MKRLFKWMPLAAIYLMSVFLPLIVVVYLAGTMIDSFERNLAVERRNSIEIVFDRFVQRMNNVESMAQMLSGNKQVWEYVYASNWGGLDTLWESKAVAELLQDYMVNSDIETMFLYNIPANQIISTGFALGDPGLFFQFHYCPVEHTEDSYGELLRQNTRQYTYSPAMEVNRLGTTKEVIEYYVPFDEGSRNIHRLQFVVVLETKDIFDGLLDIFGEESEWYVYDRSGQQIFRGGDGLGEGQKGYEMAFASENGNWTIRAMLPENLPGEAWSRTIVPILWVMFLTILVSVCLCGIFTFRNSRYIQQLLDEEHRSREQSERYRNSYQYEILYKLIKSLPVDTRKIQAFLEQEEWQFLEDRCLLLCIRMTDSKYRSDVSAHYGSDDTVGRAGGSTASHASGYTAKDLLKDRLKEILERQYVTLDISARELVCIMSLGEDAADADMRNLVTRLYVGLSYELGIELRIAAGAPADTWRELPDSYKQAKAVLKYSRSPGEPVYLYADLKEFYYYPQDTGEKLRGYILTGNREDAGAILSRIYEENLGDNGTLSSVAQGEQLVRSIWRCIREAAEACSIVWKEELPRIYTLEDVEGSFWRCQAAVEEICGQLAARSKESQTNTAIKIRNYVAEHFCEADMSLKKLSNHFKLNESYVSNLFKKEYGENLSAFISSLRIEKACNMMLQEEKTVSEVAEAVGYTSDEGFRWTFKKITGMTPVEYRKKQNERE